MFFIGIDLAWSTKNGSGVSILSGDRNNVSFVDAKILFSDNEIINYIEEYVKDNYAIITIDAPLIVPNKEGRRIAEKIVGSLFRKYDAGAHPANRTRLSQWTGKIRGEEITKILEEKGFVHNPVIKKFEETKKFFEVYPHPSMIVIFKLKSILRYKAKPKRDYEFRWREFKKYQECLKELKNLKLPPSMINNKIKSLRGKALKNYEDTLDATFCAYLAYYHWTNPEKCFVLGDMKKGYISTPIFDDMKILIKK